MRALPSQHAVAGMPRLEPSIAMAVSSGNNSLVHDASCTSSKHCCTSTCLPARQDASQPP